MKIAIVSDTHDNIPKIKSVINDFYRIGVDFVLHAGDYIAPFSVAHFMSMKIAWQGVLGNNDGEKKGLISKSEGRIVEGPLEVDLDSKKIIMVHRPEDVKDYFYNKADIIIYGHTHQRDLKRESKTLVINPGELCGYLTGCCSFAVVDLDSLSVEFIELN